MDIYVIAIKDRYRPNKLVYFNDGWTKKLSESYMFLTKDEAEEFAYMKFTRFHSWFIHNISIYNPEIMKINIIDNLIYHPDDAETLKILQELKLYKETIKEEMLDSGEVLRKVTL